MVTERDCGLSLTEGSSEGQMVKKKGPSFQLLIALDRLSVPPSALIYAAYNGGSRLQLLTRSGSSSLQTHRRKGLTPLEAVLPQIVYVAIRYKPQSTSTRSRLAHNMMMHRVTSLQYPPPWFTGTSLPDWVSLEQRREKEVKTVYT